MTDKKMGRPTVMTKEVIAKLEVAFSVGATDLQACFVAGISKDSLYDYIKLYPEFSDRKEALKDNPKYIAKNNIVDAIKAADKDMSKWYLERKDKDFSPQSKVDLTTNQPIIQLRDQRAIDNMGKLEDIKKDG